MPLVSRAGKIPELLAAAVVALIESRMALRAPSMVNAAAYLQVDEGAMRPMANAEVKE